MEETIMLPNGNRLRIVQDEDPTDPREWDNLGKICVRKHRDYIFPNELGRDFDGEDQNLHTYHAFKLDCYIHSGVSFSLTGEGMQCSFDTARNAGFIAIPKNEGEKEYTRDEAKEIAKEEIKIYNQYLDGKVYGGIVEKQAKWTSEDGRRKIEREYEDSCYGFYSIDEVKDHFIS